MLSIETLADLDRAAEHSTHISIERTNYDQIGHRWSWSCALCPDPERAYSSMGEAERHAVLHAVNTEVERP